MDRKLTNWKLIVVGQNWTSFENTDKLDTTDKIDNCEQNWKKWTKLVNVDEVGNDGQNCSLMDKIGNHG